MFITLFGLVDFSVLLLDGFAFVVFYGLLVCWYLFWLGCWFFGFLLIVR